jgi:hypothetical protein
MRSAGDVVLGVMRRHDANATVQLRCAAALRNAMVGHSRNRRAVVVGGGVAQLLRAMRGHDGDAGVQERAVAALWALCTDCKENAAAVVQAGGREDMVVALDRHGQRHEELARTVHGALAAIDDVV